MQPFSHWGSLLNWGMSLAGSWQTAPAKKSQWLAPTVDKSKVDYQGLSVGQLRDASRQQTSLVGSLTLALSAEANPP
jgi:hypothetical protein